MLFTLHVVTLYVHVLDMPFVRLKFPCLALLCHEYHQHACLEYLYQCLEISASYSIKIIIIKSALFTILYYFLDLVHRQ